MSVISTLSNRHTKIVATIGPATQDPSQLRRAIYAGVNIVRLNFSHGEHETHQKVFDSVRELSRELKAPVSILQDLQGPKIRVGHFEEGSIELTEGEEVVISSQIEKGSPGKIPSDFDKIHDVCKPGVRILLDDGLLELKVLSIENKNVHCEVVYGGTLKNRKGMNIPGVDLPVDCLTKKDLDDLEFGLKNKVDYIALSFVRKGSDIKKLRQITMEKSPLTRIVAKIEMLEALDNLEEIIELSDAVMVARGDLAVEVGHAQLPGIQKRIISLCNNLGRPVITATQMLDSMVLNPRPTRAEVTDVANAVMDGTDAVMLSAETASGEHPMQCIRTMHDIAIEVEKDNVDYYKFHLSEDFTEIPESISASACLSAQRLGAKAIVCLTSSGKTATMISSVRPKCRIIAVTSLEPTLNRLELVWGIQTFKIKPYRSTDEAMEQIEQILLDNGLVGDGEKVILTLGLPVHAGAKTNSMRVFEVSGNSSGVKENEKPLRCREITPISQI